MKNESEKKKENNFFFHLKIGASHEIPAKHYGSIVALV